MARRPFAAGRPRGMAHGALVLVALCLALSQSTVVMAALDLTSNGAALGYWLTDHSLTDTDGATSADSNTLYLWAKNRATTTATSPAATVDYVFAAPSSGPSCTYDITGVTSATGVNVAWTAGTLASTDKSQTITLTFGDTLVITCGSDVYTVYYIDHVFPWTVSTTDDANSVANYWTTGSGAYNTGAWVSGTKTLTVDLKSTDGFLPYTIPAVTTISTVDGTLTATCTGNGTNWASQSTAFHVNAEESVVFICTMTDTGSYTATYTWTVIANDVTAPTLIGMPGNQTVQATWSGGVNFTYTDPTATDPGDSSPTVVCSPASGSPNFPVNETTVVNCTAEDNGGNIAWATFDVYVEDTTKPVIIIMPSNMTEGGLYQEAENATGAFVTWTSPTATDSVDNSLDVTCTPASGSFFPINVTTTVNCTAVDDFGNGAWAILTVFVDDMNAPDVTAYNISKEAVNSTGYQLTSYNLTLFDETTSNADLRVDFSITLPHWFPLGVTSVSCNVTDNFGNMATAVFTVTVVDTTKPIIITMPSNMTNSTHFVEATSSSGAVYNYTLPTATDSVDNVLVVSCNPASGSVFPLNVTTTVNCTATDDYLNTAWASFEVFVDDTQVPDVTSANLVQEAFNSSGYYLTDYGLDVFDETTSDANLDIFCNHTLPLWFLLGVTGVSCDVTDDFGNTASTTFTVTVADTTKPTFLTMPANMTGGSSAEATNSSGAVVSWTAPTASDTVDGSVTVDCTPTSGSLFALNVTTTVNCTATDDYNNTAWASFDVFVDDTQPPIVTSSNLNKEATNSSGYYLTAYNITTDDETTTYDNMDVDCSPAVPHWFPLGVTSVLCNVTDDFGNMATTVFTVTVVDTTTPIIITMPANMTGSNFVEATDASGAVVTWNVTAATDTVDSNVTIVCIPASGSVFPLNVTTTVNCTATDDYSNAVWATFDVFVDDTSAPDWDYFPSSSAWEADLYGGAMVTWMMPNATDEVDSSPLVTCDHPSSGNYSLGVTTVVCTAEDDFLNVATRNFTVTVSDTLSPNITVPSDILNVEATNYGGAVVNYTVSAVDTADAALLVLCNYPSGSNFTIGNTTVICNATDDYNHTAYGSFIVGVRDTIAPVIFVPADFAVQANLGDGATVNFAADVTATDTADPAPEITCTPASGSAFVYGNTTVNCVAIDNAGLSDSDMFVITVVDELPPNITVPTVFIWEANIHGGANNVDWSLNVTATDNSDPDVLIVCDPEQTGTNFTIGETNVTCTAYDNFGLNDTDTFTVTVHDTLPPVVSVPANIVAEATSHSGAVQNYTLATAVDLADPSPVVACTPVTGSYFPVGVNTIICTGTDRYGNVGTNTFTATTTDTQVPVLLMKNITREAIVAAGDVITFTYNVTDIADPSPVVRCDRATSATYQVGLYPVNCNATDASGNVGFQTWYIQVVDTTPPVITVPADFAEQANTANGAIVDFAADVTAIDNGDTNVAIVCTPASGTEFLFGSTTVSCTATDNFGLTDTDSFVITVVDQVPPTITVPAVFIWEANIYGGANNVDWSMNVTAVDNSDQQLLIVCDPDQTGTNFTIGDTNVTCTAFDEFANNATATFTVTVQDTLPPVLTIPNNFTVEANIFGGANVSYTMATAVDLADPMPFVDCYPDSYTNFSLGYTTVNCTAEDDYANVAWKSFIVTVDDTVPPAFHMDNITVEGTNPYHETVTYAYNVSDVADPYPMISCDQPLTNNYSLGANPVRCNATDASGNLASLTWYINIVDTTPPNMTVPADIVGVEATGYDGATVSWPASEVNATDLVDTVLDFLCVPASGSVFPVGITEVNCTATDNSGNVDWATFNVTVVDTIAPTLYVDPTWDGYWTTVFQPPGTWNESGNSYLDLEGSAYTMHFSWIANATDIADSMPTIECMDVEMGVLVDPLTNATVEFNATTTFNCSAVDDSGNRSPWQFFRVFVGDHRSPNLTVDPTQFAPGMYYTNPAQYQPGAVYDNATAPPVLEIDADALVMTYTWTAYAVDLVDPAPFTRCFNASSGEEIYSDLGVDLVVNETITIFCNASDHSLNPAGPFEFNVTIVDLTPPNLDVDPTDEGYWTDEYIPGSEFNASTHELNIDCNNPYSVNYTFSTNVTDLNDAFPILTCWIVDTKQLINDTDVFDLMLGTTTTFACNATDLDWNVAYYEWNVTIDDRTPPDVFVSSDLTFEGTSPSGAVATYTPANATDLVDLQPTILCLPASGTVFPVGTTVVNCTATDDFGNVGWNSFNVSVVDTTDPMIYVPDNFIFEANAPYGATIMFNNTVNATDIVDTNVTIVCVPALTSFFPQDETTEVNCTATDYSGNSDWDTFNVTVVDTTAPAWVSPLLDRTVEANTAYGATVNYTVIAIDAADPAPVVVCDPPSGSFFELDEATLEGSHDVYCNATDASGNVYEDWFTITVEDTIKPSLTVPSTIIKQADTAGGVASVTYTYTVVDIADPAPDVSCTQDSGTFFPLGVTSVSCMAVDYAGNIATEVITVTVRDDIPPNVTLVSPGHIYEEADSAAGSVVLFDVIVRDIEDVSPTLVCTPLASGDTFPITTTNVTCTAVDRSGNNQTISLLVTVQDTTPPVLSIPTNITADANIDDGATVVWDVSAVDIVDSAVDIVCDPPSGSNFTLGYSNVTCTATDEYGNYVTKWFTVYVIDVTPPTLYVPDDIEIEADETLGALVYFDYNATDAGDAHPNVQCSPEPGFFDLGVTNVTCTATDISGNVAEDWFLVTVVDTTAPDLTVPSNIIRVISYIDGPSIDGTNVTLNVTAFDICWPNITTNCTDLYMGMEYDINIENDFFGHGFHEVDCFSLDGSGNIAVAEFTTPEGSPPLPPVRPSPPARSPRPVQPPSQPSPPPYGSPLPSPSPEPVQSPPPAVVVSSPPPRAPPPPPREIVSNTEQKGRALFNGFVTCQVVTELNSNATQADGTFQIDATGADRIRANATAAARCTDSVTKAAIPDSAVWMWMPLDANVQLKDAIMSPLSSIASSSEDIISKLATLQSEVVDNKMAQYAKDLGVAPSITQGLLQYDFYTLGVQTSTLTQNGLVIYMMQSQVSSALVLAATYFKGLMEKDGCTQEVAIAAAQKSAAALLDAKKIKSLASLEDTLQFFNTTLYNSMATLSLKPVGRRLQEEQPGARRALLAAERSLLQVDTAATAAGLNAIATSTADANALVNAQMASISAAVASGQTLDLDALKAALTKALQASITAQTKLADAAGQLGAGTLDPASFSAQYTGAALTQLANSLVVELPSGAAPPPPPGAVARPPSPPPAPAPPLFNNTESGTFPPPPPPAGTDGGSPTDESNGLSGGAIAGIVIGVVAGVIIITVIVIIVVRRRRAAQNVTPAQNNMQPPAEAGQEA
ncbi:hypothetical protein HYH03_017915 [Edaphochlamys debaryana]|uniref:HYR domain-containing protein n=1 Tax=Edaphochlamys debaryana TaxID=47281 RepID=A0A835XHJ1_9CHLO|nr:hypothetical protein HYH03_017915 [Edaphochlamys debaryana]|eukprot:KAG2483217.1 hypothetical protein HYH03_017915 [Edaphochlamys debaryana]